MKYSQAKMEADVGNINDRLKQADAQTTDLELKSAWLAKEAKLRAQQYEQQHEGIEEQGQASPGWRKRTSWKR